MKSGGGAGGGSGQNTPAQGVTPNSSMHMHQLQAAATDSTSSAQNRSRANSSSLADQQRHLDTTVLSRTAEHLSKFDACVEACDALAASPSASTTMARRRDPETGLLDCSVLVSPDGDLLLLPQDQSLRGSLHSGTASDNDAVKTGDKQNKRQLLEHGSSTSSIVSELAEDFESAIYVGNDLSIKGEKELNGFSANGWSIPATNLALRQTEQSLHDFADFCEEIVLSKKVYATKTKEASDKLRAVSFERGPVYPEDLQYDQELMLGHGGAFELNPNRVGPLRFNGGTLHAAHVAMEEYYTDIAEKENSRWRLASLKPKQGTLPPLRRAATLAEERSSQRQKALRDMYSRVKTMEEHLAECKKEAQRRWKDVEMGEMKVHQIAQSRLVEQHRKKEKERLDIFQQAGEQQGAVAAASNPNAAEVWNLVSQLTETMEDGGFEPMNMPSLQQLSTSNGGAAPDSPTTTPVELPQPQRPAAAQINVDDIEDEVGMHELRAAAFAADRAVQDASGSLLNVLSSLDQLRRSARVAAETNLLSACNSQAECIRAMIQLERAAAEERLKHIEELEKIADKIDVRRDLDTYIRDDRKRAGGQSLLGDDDDGGVASALAVLTNHLEGDMGDDVGGSHLSDDDNEGMAEKVTMEEVEQAIETLFAKDPLLRSDASDTGERQEALDKFDKSVQLLCDVATEKSRAARPRRSRMCYALNAKRSSDAEIKTKKQFDALCKVFVAILDGCDCETGGVSNAKMCMMLSQTFFFLQEPSGENGNAAERSKRIYVQRHLLDHPLWAQEEFWDQVLYQCLSESLTNSGVMSNFERRKSKDDTDHSSEWADSHKTKWFDLSPIERTEAASQVHAVVTAQLGALAHSMLEFNCGLERSCAFVRRMAIRNQLPLSQRSILLQHLIARKLDSDSSPNEFGVSFTNNDENEQNKVNPTEDKEVPAAETASKDFFSEVKQVDSNESESAAQSDDAEQVVDEEPEQPKEELLEDTSADHVDAKYEL